MRSGNLFFLTLAAALIFSSCNNSGDEKKTEEKKAAQLIEDNTTYSADSANMKGYVVYSDSFEGKRPAILVVHEWWGLNDYSKSRAKQLEHIC
jgi:hypothetical protein